VKRLGEDFYEVAVKETPEKGRANAIVVELLSRRKRPTLASNLL
jgi:uncharacterized protein YggU (UPF0235/DUF167 family)